MVASTRRSAITAALGSLIAAPFIPDAFAAPQASVLPGEADVLAILAQRIDAQKQSRGIILGLVGPGGTRFVAHGAISSSDPRTPAAETLFGIGSISKVFTAILLADAVRRGQMRLDDPVSLHLPASATMPAPNGRAITLADLATHTSGLPVLPDDYPGESDTAGRARYGWSDAWAFLKAYRPAAAPGVRWTYSNFNYEIIAAALSHRTGLGYDELLRRRVTTPLGLGDTALTLTTAQQARLAPGHDVGLRQLPPQTRDIMSMASGGLYSSARDLISLVSAFMGYRRNSLSPVFTAMLATRRPTGGPSGEQAIGPQIAGQGERQQIGHSGSKPGYAASVLWTPGRFGVVVLSNAAPPVLDISQHLLNPAMPLAEPIRFVALDAGALDRFVGRYRAANGMTFVITHEANGLAFEAVGGAPKVDLTPESDGVFTVPRMGARISFEGQAPAPPASIRVEFGGATYTGVRG